MILLSHLVGGRVHMQQASLEGTEDHSLKGSRVHILVAVELVQNVKGDDALALRQLLQIIALVNEG